MKTLTLKKIILESKHEPMMMSDHEQDPFFLQKMMSALTKHQKQKNIHEG